ncbi:hypothetical protein C6A85_09645, partial [Mycobacterium sp. ITM-2017-0098]
FTRPFVSEITILQRERSPDIPQSLWLIGCLVVLVCTLAMIAGANAGTASQMGWSARMATS